MLRLSEDVNWFSRQTGGVGVPGRLSLITPALFSRPPPRPSGRRGRNTLKVGFLSPLSPVRWGEVGRERVGRVRAHTRRRFGTAAIEEASRASTATRALGRSKR